MNEKNLGSVNLRADEETENYKIRNKENGDLIVKI